MQRSISPSLSFTCISPVPPGHSTSSKVDPASFSASCSRGERKCSRCQPTLSFCDMVRDVEEDPCKVEVEAVGLKGIR
jgi:hypothetical protein